MKHESHDRTAKIFFSHVKSLKTQKYNDDGNKPTDLNPGTVLNEWEKGGHWSHVNETFRSTFVQTEIQLSEIFSSWTSFNINKMLKYLN